MASTMDPKKLYEWCRIPAADLPNHPDSKVKLKVFEKKADAPVYLGNLMADEVKANNAAGKPTKWILPAGPMEQYETFANRVNAEGISLKDTYVFHMDDFLDWQGRPYPVRDNYYSLEGNMLAGFYGIIDPKLTVPEENRFFPRIDDLDAIDDKIVELGGVDTLVGGLGCKGLVGFCEAPQSPWFTVSVEEYAQSKTRVVWLNNDTIISLSERDMGGLTHNIPPMAVTMGFKSMLNCRRAIFLVTTGGGWKRTAIRVTMFSEPTVEYPSTLFPRYVPEVTLLCDGNTTQPPMGDDA